MSAACGCDEPTTSPADEAEETERPWWRDPGLVVPILSGVAFGTGLALEWSGLHIAALVAFWAGLLLGAYTFVPGAIRNLVVKRKLGIALLMTISAVGAVILGYVEEAAALAVLYSIAEALEDKAMDRARGGLRALLKLVPETATVLRDGTSASVPAREIAVGDVLLVRPGERVATDGLVRSGRSSLDTSAITGESIPVEVAPGEAVSAGAINSAGVLEVEATAAGTDNSLTTIVELVEQAQAEKGDRARIADRIARRLVPGVMILAVPGARHLYGMKEVLYDAPYENEEHDTDYEGFEFLGGESVRREITVEGAENIEALFSMTPYYWKTDVAGGERLRRLDTLKTEIKFRFLVYRRR